HVGGGAARARGAARLHGGPGTSRPVTATGRVRRAVAVFRGSGRIGPGAGGRSMMGVAESTGDRHLDDGLCADLTLRLVPRETRERALLHAAGCAACEERLRR